MKQLYGKGVFAWDSIERRTNRYGSFTLNDSPYNDIDKVEVVRNDEVLNALVAKRVRVTAIVVENRPSDHIGDQFLGIKPPNPPTAVGTEIDLGVGVLMHAPDWAGNPAPVLMPIDGREELWIDPRQLFKLHDQTVEVHFEETTDECSPAPQIKMQEPGVLDNGEGTFQVKKVGEGPLVLEPEIKRIGDGLFELTPPTSKKYGHRIKHRSQN